MEARWEPPGGGLSEGAPALGLSAAPAPPEARAGGDGPEIPVLVTGVGGSVGQSVIKCLEDTRYRIVGVDASEYAAGLHAVPRGYLVPLARDPAYVDRLLEICVAERVRYLFAGLDMELPILARARERFRERGILPLVSPPGIVDLANDKLETIRFLESHGLPAARTWEVRDVDPRELDYPVVLKPRRGGSRSQGVYAVGTEEEYLYRLDTEDPSNYVVQEYVAGEEYTCGSLSFDGTCHGVIVMRRTLRDGDTHKAFVVRNPALENFVGSLAEILGPFGPCNFQLRVREGWPYVFDINARCSGTTYCRALAGFNEPRMALDYLETGRIPSFEIREISVFRYWKELVVENARLDEVRRAGTTTGVGRRL